MDREAMRATYEHGLLAVTLPRANQSDGINLQYLVIMTCLIQLPRRLGSKGCWSSPCLEPIMPRAKAVMER